MTAAMETRADMKLASKTLLSICLSLLVCALFSNGAAAKPLFKNRASDQDFSHQYTGGWEHFVGGGVAVFDCNDDGFPEIFASGGESNSVLLLNKTGVTGAELRFEPDTRSPLVLTGTTGAYPIDINGDQIIDLAVLRVGENLIYQGQGNCRFSLANGEWAFDGRDRWTTAFSATWEKGSDLPTLAFGNYVNRDDPEGPFFACDDNALYRPNERRYQHPILLTPGYCALSMIFSDWGRKGVQDLRISNDRHYYVRGGSEQLWRLTPDIGLYGEVDGWQPLSIWGMGIASRDIDGNGIPEVFLTSMGDQKLRILPEDAKSPTYADASFHSGTTAHMPYIGDEGRPSSGWHAAFGDVDNDGLDDLFIAKGNVDQMPDAAMRDPNNLLMQQADGTFGEFGDKAGIATTDRARGGALVDLNRDGRLDIVVNNRRAGLELNENLTVDAGHWLAVELRQQHSNTQAVGSWIEVSNGNRTWHREVTIGGGHAGGVLGFHHFGVGGNEDLRLRVIWPDGKTSGWHDVQTDQHIRVERLGERLRILERFQ